MLSNAKLEVCVDTMDGVLACQTGVDTIELCSALSLGGLTPSAGFMALSQSSVTPVHAMIRPRAGSFVYSPEEIAVMLKDIASAKSAGLAGVVFGAATSDRRLDVSVLRQLVDASSGLGMTLHRVIDTLLDPVIAVEQAIDLGFSRILTSGGQPNAKSGTETLKNMVKSARGRVEIIVGSGVSSENVRQIAQDTGARSFHSSCSQPSPQTKLDEEFGFSPPQMRETDPAKIASMRKELNALN